MTVRCVVIAKVLKRDLGQPDSVVSAGSIGRSGDANPWID
jgi:hypothetical protein